MTNQEFEYKVQNIIERVLDKQPIEDDTVELKSEWLEPAQVARRLAAHANCARGVPILWIIGLDENNGLVGANKMEVSNWYAGIQARFDDGICPNLAKCLNIPYSGKTVFALLFETDRAPYVVKNEAGGQITREVPWRKSNRTDSASRSDLLKILVPLQLSPAFEAVDGYVHLGEKRQFIVEMKLYITPRTSGLLVIPFHRCKGKIIFASGFEVDLDRISLLAPQRLIGGTGLVQESVTIQHTHYEVVISGPGTMTLEGFAEVASLSEMLSDNLEVKISIKYDPEAEMPVVLNSSFVRVEAEDNGKTVKWVLRQRSNI